MPCLQTVLMLDIVATVSFVFVVGFCVVRLTFVVFVLVVVHPYRIKQLYQMPMHPLLERQDLVILCLNQIVRCIFVALCLVRFVLSHLERLQELVNLQSLDQLN